MRKAVPTLPAVLRDPGPVVKAIRLDDERVSVPPADRISHVSQNRGIRRQFAPVWPDGPPRMTQLKELQNSVGQLDELHPIVVSECPWITQAIADIHRIL